MSRFRAVLVACAVAVAAPAFGASPDPKDLGVSPVELSKARELVRRLGSEVYREREEVQADLAKMGRLARLAVAEGAATDADPEVRLRCARLLPKANSDDLKARIDTFLEDKDGKFEHDLPGLKTFRKSVGADDKARALYVEVLKSPYNLDMFAALDKGTTEGGRAISDRRNAMWNDMQNRQFAPGSKPFVPKQPTLPDIAALLFAETLVPADSIPKTGVWTFVNGVQFIHQAASMSALQNAGAAHGDTYKVIVGRWLGTRTDPTEMTNLSYQLGNPPLRQFKESLPLLRRIILTDGVQGYAKGQALNALVQQRGKEEVPFLRAILKNELRVGDYPEVFPNEKNPNRTLALNNDAMIQQVWFQKGNGQDLHSCLMKDAALAFLISQTGGNIKDYGFETQQGVVINPKQLLIGQYAFTSDEKRATGFMKYGWKQLKDGIDPPAPKDAPKEVPKTGTVPPK